MNEKADLFSFVWSASTKVEVAAPMTARLNSDVSSLESQMPFSRLMERQEIKALSKLCERKKSMVSIPIKALLEARY